jgi:hypothetical protein
MIELQINNSRDVIQNESLDRNKKAGRKKKIEKYNIERINILNTIKNILEITDENKVFYLYDIDTNKDKQQQIVDLKSQIETCFKSKNSAVFMPDDKKAIRPYMSLIRLVFKEMGFHIVVTRVTIYREEKSIYTSMYSINKTI